MKLDKFRLEIKMPIFNSNRVNRFQRDVIDCLELEPAEGTGALPAAGLQEARCWSGRWDAGGEQQAGGVMEPPGGRFLGAELPTSVSL